MKTEQISCGEPVKEIQDLRLDDHLAITTYLNAATVDFPILFRFNDKYPHRLYVLLAAAINRASAVLPVFNRWKWAAKFPGHVLCIADPSLYLAPDYALGWYVGTRSIDVTEKLAWMVSAVAARLYVPNDNIVFYGSSGGGFAAMMAAVRLHGSTAVAINPQARIFSYHIRRVVETFRKVAFPELDWEAIELQHGHRVDVVRALEQVGVRVRVIYAQNTLDHQHFDYHFEYVRSRVSNSSNIGFESLLYTHPSGHASETPEVFEEIIRLTGRSLG